MDIHDVENPKGIIVSTGGQIPNNLAIKLFHKNVNILGTSPKSIDRAENRHKFSAMLDTLEIDQPAWKELSSVQEIYTFVNKVGFPVLVRPSYVLSGSAMNTVSNISELDGFPSFWRTRTIGQRGIYFRFARFQHHTLRF